MEQSITESGPKDSTLLVFYTFWGPTDQQVSQCTEACRALPMTLRLSVIGNLSCNW